MKKYINIFVGFILLVSTVIFFHNIITYPAVGGFDYERRTDYARILSHELRLPTYEETSEVYDAPAFYFLSGLFGRAVSAASGLSFLDALAYVRYLTAILGIFSFYLWYKIFIYLNPKDKSAAVFFVFFLASIPVFYRVGSMIVSELLTLFNASLTFYWLITKYLPKPNLKNGLVLSLLIGFGLITRITFFSVAFAVAIVLLIKKHIKYLALIAAVALIFNGWFYLGRQQGKLLNFGTVKEIYDKAPTHEPIRPDFYYKFPLKLTLHYPVRPFLSYPSYLLPIYYADFWGDYWNYFAQTRFGENEFWIAKIQRQFYSEARRLNLARQTQINLIPTLTMISAFIFVSIKNFKKIDLIFSLAVIFIWISLLAIVTKYPGGEGDWIKAPYSLIIIPIYCYFTAVFLFNYISKIKIIFWPALAILLFSAVNNLVFSWF